MNLASLQLRDPHIVDIVDSSGQVSIFVFNKTFSAWEHVGINGGLYVFKRSCAPVNGFMVISPLCSKDVIVLITADLEFQCQDQLLLYRNKNSFGFGIWFYERSDFFRIAHTLKTLLHDIKKSISKRLPDVPVATASGDMDRDTITRQCYASSNDLLTAIDLCLATTFDEFSSSEEKEGHGEHARGSASCSIMPNDCNVDILEILSRAQNEYEKANDKNKLTSVVSVRNNGNPDSIVSPTRTTDCKTVTVTKVKSKRMAIRFTQDASIPTDAVRKSEMHVVNPTVWNKEQSSMQSIVSNISSLIIQPVDKRWSSGDQKDNCNEPMSILTTIQQQGNVKSQSPPLLNYTKISQKSSNILSASQNSQHLTTDSNLLSSFCNLADSRANASWLSASCVDQPLAEESSKFEKEWQTRKKLTEGERPTVTEGVKEDTEHIISKTFQRSIETTGSEHSVSPGLLCNSAKTHLQLAQNVVLLTPEEFRPEGADRMDCSHTGGKTLPFNFGAIEQQSTAAVHAPATYVAASSQYAGTGDNIPRLPWLGSTYTCCASTNVKNFSSYPVVRYLPAPSVDRQSGLNMVGCPPTPFIGGISRGLAPGYMTVSGGQMLMNRPTAPYMMRCASDTGNVLVHSLMPPPARFPVAGPSNCLNGNVIMQSPFCFRQSQYISPPPIEPSLFNDTPYQSLQPAAPSPHGLGLPSFGGQAPLHSACLMPTCYSVNSDQISSSTPCLQPRTITGSNFMNACDLAQQQGALQTAFVGASTAMPFQLFPYRCFDNSTIRQSSNDRPPVGPSFFRPVIYASHGFTDCSPSSINNPISSNDPRLTNASVPQSSIRFGFHSIPEGIQFSRGKEFQGKLVNDRSNQDASKKEALKLSQADLHQSLPLQLESSKQLSRQQVQSCMKQLRDQPKHIMQWRQDAARQSTSFPADLRGWTGEAQQSGRLTNQKATEEEQVQQQLPKQLPRQQQLQPQHFQQQQQQFQLQRQWQVHPLQQQLMQQQQPLVYAATKERLRSAFIDVLNNDPDFLGVVHSAYVESLDRQLAAQNFSGKKRL